MLAPVVILAALALGFGIAGWLKKEGGQPVPSFLPGVYTCVAANEFCRIEDTLVVRRARMESDDYLLTRSTRFTRIRAGREGPSEMTQQQWQAHYNADKYLLTDTKQSDTVRYYPEQNRISKANFYYEKIE